MINLRLDTTLQTPPADTTTQSISTESFTEQVDTNSNNGPGSPCIPQQPQAILLWNKTTTSTGTEWSFFLNGEMSDSVINEFVNRMLLVQDIDKVFIYGPVYLTIDDAEIIASAMELCKSKNITISSPYVFSAGAAYVMCFAQHILWSPACVAHISVPDTCGYGQRKDAVHRMLNTTARGTRLMKVLVENRFITEEELANLRKTQSELALFGEKYKQIIEQFNQTHGNTL